MPLDRSRECEIDGCKEHHHRILHQEKSPTDGMEGKVDPSYVDGNKSSTYETVKEREQRRIARRTVPVILKHGQAVAS